MSWPEALVVIAGIAGFVALVHVALPFVRTRSDEQRRELALKSVNERIDKVESAVAERRFPTALGRKTA